FAPLADRASLPPPIAKDGIEGWPVGCRAEGQARGFHAAAPRTGPHVLHDDAALSKGDADTPRILAPRFGEIALTRASARVERVGSSRRRRRVAHDHDLAPALEEGPDRLVGRRDGRGG